MLAWPALHGQSYTSFFTGNPVDAVTVPAGGICLMGGSTESDDAMRWFLTRANGGDVLVLRASGSNGYNNYLYSELGIPVNSVETIVFNNASASYDTYVRQRIQRAEAIWIAGGDQWRYVSFWRNTPVDSLINVAIQQRNIVIGGTSAGMAILGRYYFSAQNGAISSTDALNNPFHVRMTVEGAPFLQNYHLRDVITDTHYDNPNRKGRHVAFLARIFNDWGVEAKGIACDEFTAVCVDPAGNAVAYGGFPAYDDNAYFIQFNCDLSVRHPETCQPNTPLHWFRNAQALKVYKVKGTPAGHHRFSLADWKTGSGGVWEHWYVQNGVLAEAPGGAPNCIATSTADLQPEAGQAYLLANPVSDALVVVFPDVARRIQVMDTSGRLVCQATPSATGRWALDVSAWPRGLYLLQVHTSHGRQTLRWVKG